jgi:hypothetical protein
VRRSAPWQPKRNTLALLDQVRAVLAEYADYLPLMLRQIFYRLVGAQRRPASDTRMPGMGNIRAAAVHGMTTMKSVPSPVSLLMP